MSDVNIVVGITGDVSGGRVIKKSLDDINSANNKATSSSKQLENQVRATTMATGGLSRAFQLLTASFGITQIVRTVDLYQNLNARVKEATRATGDYNRVQKELIDLSIRTGSSLESNVTLFQRLAGSRRDLGITNQQILELTESVNQLGAVGGSSVDGIKNATLQLSQALSGGTVRAEEFNSIVENMKPVADAVAKSMGISFGELRKRIIDGTMSSKEFAKALLDGSKDAEEAFNRLPPTIGRAWQNLKTNTGLALNDINELTGASNVLASAIDGIGKAIKNAFVGAGSYLRAFMLAMQEVNISLADAKLTLTAIGSMVPSLDPTVRAQRKQSAEDAAQNLLNQQDKLQRMIEESVNGPTPTQQIIEQEAPLKRIHEQTKAQKKAEKKLQDDLTDAIKQSRSETEKLYDEIEAMERLKPFAKTKEQSDAIAKNIKNAREELDKLRIEAELNSPVGKAFQSLASEIDDGFKDAFKSAFTESDGGFKALLNGWKNTFKNFLAELAYQAFARPIVVSVVGAVGGIMGLSSGAIASAASTGGSLGTSIGSGGSLFSGIGSLFSAGSSLLSGGLGAGLGASAAKLGAGLGLNFSQTASLQKFATGAGSMANIGGGIVGGGLASLMGLGNKNGLVSGGAGIAGGLIGQALIPVPFLGAAIGSFVGTAISGLFGGKKPSDKAQGGIIDFASGAASYSGQSGKKFSQENATFRDTIFNTMSSVLGTIKQYGGSASGSAEIVVGSRDGLRYNGQNFGNNSQAFTDKIFADLRNSITGLDETFTTILNKVGVQNAGGLADAFAFGQSYKDALNPKTVASQLADAIKVLNDNMQTLIDTATFLGLPIEEYTKALDKQKEAAIGALKAQAAGFSSLEEMTKTFKAFLDGQSLGTNSSLNPMEKLGLAQSNFDTLLKTAQGGDLSVTTDLLGAAATLIELGRGIYASSVSFVALESFVRSSVTEIAKAAGVPGYAKGTNSAAAGIAMVGEQGRELVRMSGGEQVYTAGQTAGIMALSGNASGDIVRSNQQISAIMQDSVEENRASRKELIKMRKVMERLTNYMKVAA